MRALSLSLSFSRANESRRVSFPRARAILFAGDRKLFAVFFAAGIQRRTRCCCRRREAAARYYTRMRGRERELRGYERGWEMGIAKMFAEVKIEDAESWWWWDGCMYVYFAIGGISREIWEGERLCVIVSRIFSDERGNCSRDCG